MRSPFTIATPLSPHEVNRRLQRIVRPKMSHRDRWRWYFGTLRDDHPFHGVNRHHAWELRLLTRRRTSHPFVIVRVTETESGSTVRIRVWPGLTSVVVPTVVIAAVTAVAVPENTAIGIGFGLLVLVVSCAAHFGEAVRIAGLIRREL